MYGYGSGRPASYLTTSECQIIPAKEYLDWPQYDVTYTPLGKNYRPWFISPCCKRRVAYLYIPPRQQEPACRVCLHLNYQSQRRTPEEKGRLYEKHLLTEGYLHCIEKYNELPVHYLSKEESDYYYHLGQQRRMIHFIGRKIEYLLFMSKMQKIEEKQERMEKRAIELEKKYKKQKDVPVQEIEKDLTEIEELLAA